MLSFFFFFKNSFCFAINNIVSLWEVHPFNTIVVHRLYYVPVSEIYRGSYMSAHVLLNLFNELGKRDNMRGLPSIFSFCND